VFVFVLLAGLVAFSFLVQFRNETSRATAVDLSNGAVFFFIDPWYSFTFDLVQVSCFMSQFYSAFICTIAWLDSILL
jgi:hypothetical protein